MQADGASRAIQLPSKLRFVAFWVQGQMAQEPLVASLLLVAMPGAPSSVLAPSSNARSP